MKIILNGFINSIVAKIENSFDSLPMYCYPYATYNFLFGLDIRRIVDWVNKMGVTKQYLRIIKITTKQ